MYRLKLIVWCLGKELGLPRVGCGEVPGQVGTDASEIGNWTVPGEREQELYYCLYWGAISRHWSLELYFRYISILNKVLRCRERERERDIYIYRTSRHVIRRCLGNTRLVWTCIPQSVWVISDHSGYDRVLYVEFNWILPRGGMLGFYFQIELFLW